MSSLAGRVSRPALPAGEVRVGGFGGVSGLRDYLRTAGIVAVVDATHPFAAQISANAVAAAEQCRTPSVRLERPSWHEHADAGTWTWVPDAAGVLTAAADAKRPFLTTGRQSLPSFFGWADRDVVVRVVDPPEVHLPERWTVIRSRGPYDYPKERRLLSELAIDTLVIKDSGGDLTASKLDAARDLGVPVVVIERPPRPAGGSSVATLAEVLDWLFVNVPG